MAIPLAENKTLRIGLEEILTDSLISAYRQDKRLEVANLEDADIIIQSSIKNFAKTPFSYDASQNISLWKVTIECQVQCEERLKESNLWEGEFSAFGTYDPNREDEGSAINEAIGKICREIVHRTFSQW